MPRDIADLLVMSTVDQKAPLAAPGSADLLDAMVQEHLERNADVAPRREEASESFPPAETPPVQSGKILQREIDMLLHDEAEETTPPASPPVPQQETASARQPPAPPGVEEAKAQERQSSPTDSSQLPAEPKTDNSAAGVSEAEIDVLLSRQAEAPPASAPAAQETGAAVAAADAPAVSAAIVEQQLSEAEGVLAEELAQLVAESGMAASAHPAVNTPPAAQPASGGAPKSAAIVDESANAPVETTAPRVASATTSPEAPGPAHAAAETAPAAQAAATASPDAPPVPGTEAESVVENEPAVAAPSGSPARRLAEGIALTAAQLIDLPFRWLNDLDRNIIGIAALLLLLGGVVLFVLSRISGA